MLILSREIWGGPGLLKSISNQIPGAVMLLAQGPAEEQRTSAASQPEFSVACHGPGDLSIPSGLYCVLFVFITSSSLGPQPG